MSNQDGPDSCTNGTCRNEAKWILHGASAVNKTKVVLWACDDCKSPDIAAAFGVKWKPWSKAS